jgi:hypothetical protein
MPSILDALPIVSLINARLSYMQTTPGQDGGLACRCPLPAALGSKHCPDGAKLRVSGFPGFAVPLPWRSAVRHWQRVSGWLLGHFRAIGGRMRPGLRHRSAAVRLARQPSNLTMARFHRQAGPNSR